MAKLYDLINRTRRKVSVDILDGRRIASETLRIPARGRACGVTEDVAYSDEVKKLVATHVLKREAASKKAKGTTSKSESSSSETSSGTGARSAASGEDSPESGGSGGGKAPKQRGRVRATSKATEEETD